MTCCRDRLLTLPGSQGVLPHGLERQGDRRAVWRPHARPRQEGILQACRAESRESVLVDTVLRQDRSGLGAESTKFTDGTHIARGDGKEGVGATGGSAWTEKWLKFDNSYFTTIPDKAADPELLKLSTDRVLFEDPVSAQTTVHCRDSTPRITAHSYATLPARLASQLMAIQLYDHVDDDGDAMLLVIVGRGGQAGAMPNACLSATERSRARNLR